MLEELIKLLGWQGGTRQQVFDEIVRLRRAEDLLRSYQDRLKFEANSEGGFVAHVDRVIGRSGDEGSR